MQSCDHDTIAFPSFDVAVFCWLFKKYRERERKKRFQLRIYDPFWIRPENYLVYHPVTHIGQPDTPEKTQSMVWRYSASSGGPTQGWRPPPPRPVAVSHQTNHRPLGIPGWRGTATKQSSALLLPCRCGHLRHRPKGLIPSLPGIIRREPRSHGISASLASAHAWTVQAYINRPRPVLRRNQGRQPAKRGCSFRRGCGWWRNQLVPSGIWGTPGDVASTKGSDGDQMVGLREPATYGLKAIALLHSVAPPPPPPSNWYSDTYSRSHRGAI